MSSASIPADFTAVMRPADLQDLKPGEIEFINNATGVARSRLLEMVKKDRKKFSVTNTFKAEKKRAIEKHSFEGRLMLYTVSRIIIAMIMKTIDEIEKMMEKKIIEDLDSRADNGENVSFQKSLYENKIRLGQIFELLS